MSQKPAFVVLSLVAVLSLLCDAKPQNRAYSTYNSGAGYGPGTGAGYGPVIGASYGPGTGTIQTKEIETTSMNGAGSMTTMSKQTTYNTGNPSQGSYGMSAGYGR